MRRLEEALRQRAERGNPVGADELITRIDRELRDVATDTLLAVSPGEGAMQTKEEPIRTDTATTPRWPRYALAFAGGLVLLAAAIGIPLFVIGGSESVVNDPSTTTTIEPTTTVAPPTTVTPMMEPEAWKRVGADVMNPAVGLFHMARVDSRLIAVGFDPGEEDRRQNGVVFASQDGITWTQLAADDPALSTGAVLMYSVTAGGPGIVAVGMGCENDDDFCTPYGTAWTSVDGSVWSRTAHDPAVFGDLETTTSAMTDVLATDEGLIAIGSLDRWTLDADGEAEGVTVHPAVWTSPDGASWTAAWEGPGVDLTVDDISNLITSPMYAIAQGPGGRLVATGATIDANADYVATSWVSADGISWQQIDSDPVVFGPGTVMADVEYGPDGFVAVGTDGGSLPAVWRSPDGEVWTRVEAASLPADTFGSLAAVAVVEGGYVAAGPQPWLDETGGGVTLWTSPDGEHWDRVHVVGSGYVESIVADSAGTAVAGGLCGVDDCHAGVWVGPTFDPVAPPPAPQALTPAEGDEDDGPPVDPATVAGAEVLMGDPDVQTPGNEYVAVDDATRLPLGARTDLPESPRWDFHAAHCDSESCEVDPNVIDPDDERRGTGGWVAEEPFHIRHGFVNDGAEPLSDDYEVMVFVTRREGPELGTGVFDLDQTYRFTSDYVIRGETAKCGPGFWEQTEVTTCEWFVHDFPDGLPAGRYDIWVGWYAPCAAWLDRGLVDACADGTLVSSEFSSAVNSPLIGEAFTEGNPAPHDPESFFAEAEEIVRGWPAE